MVNKTRPNLAPCWPRSPLSVFFPSTSPYVPVPGTACTSQRPSAVSALHPRLRPHTCALPRPVPPPRLACLPTTYSFVKTQVKCCLPYEAFPDTCLVSPHRDTNIPPLGSPTCAQHKELAPFYVCEHLESRDTIWLLS